MKFPLKRVLQKCDSLCKSRRVTGVAFALLAAVFGTAATQAQSSTPAPVEVRKLTPNEVVHTHIEFGEKHVYELALGQHEFAQIDLEQHGLDLKLTAIGPPELSFSIAVDSPNGFFGPEMVSLLAPVAGNYHITVAYSSEAPYPPGDYELRVNGPRARTALDEIRVSAERVFAEAQQLRRSQPTQAIEKYNEAIRLWRELDDRRQLGYALTNIGRAHIVLGQLAPALQNLDQATTVLLQAGDLSGEAFALNESGAAQRDLGDLREAVVLYHAALKIRIDLGDRFGQAQIYNNLGLTYSNMGYQPRSVENHEKALTIWRELKVRHHEMNTLNSAAKSHVEMGDVELAHSQYQTLLDFCHAELSGTQSPLRETARRLKPSALNGLGLVYDTWGETDSALINYEEALSLFRENQNKSGEADVLNNLGMTYAFLGDAQQAIDYFKQALELRRNAHQPRAWGITLSNLGYAYALLGNYAEAERQLTLALSLSEDAYDRRFEAYTLVRLGMTYVALSSPQPLKAVEYYKKALVIQQEPGFEDLRGQAITLDKIAEALALSGQKAAALKKYEDASERWKAVGDEHGQALSLYGIARIERDRLNLANARDRVQEAIGIVEKLRNRVTSRDLQMKYFASKQDLYALAIDVRMQLYDAKKDPADCEAALAFSEKARARNLLDLLADAGVYLYKGMSPKDAERARRLDHQISELTQYLVRSRGMNTNKDTADVQQRIEVYIKEHDQLLAPFKRAAARTRQAQPLSPREIQQLLEDDMLLLQFWLDDDHSHLWAVTRTDIQHHYLPGRAQIEYTANQLRQALIGKEAQRKGESDVDAIKRRQSAPARYQQSATELSRMILQGVASQLGNKRLVIVADGNLHYIPFEALPVPESVGLAQHASATSQRPLMLQNNEIIYQPSASALAMLRRTRRPIASKRVAVLADPVFTNEKPNGIRGIEGSKPVHIAKARLTRSLRDIGDIGNGDVTLQRLEYSLKEANEIAKVAPPGSRKYVRFKANRALATSPILKQFGFIHFATHGLLNDKNPELSGIVLSMVNERGEAEDGYLTLRDIYKLDLPSHLVVVSACETGIGVSVRGEGLIGLTRGFMNAGAKGVVVSLWRVEDEATAELMRRFYNHMFGKKELSPAAALRQAKIEMKDHYHPYQWAGFVLQGDWK
jgi:CHAT domain-containing protein/tetratricopeptide (TPR) repeat protein